MYVCRSSFACEWFCKLRLFAHVPSLGSNHGMRVCDIPSHATGLLICCPWSQVSSDATRIALSKQQIRLLLKRFKLVALLGFGRTSWRVVQRDVFDGTLNWQHMVISTNGSSSEWKDLLHSSIALHLSFFFGRLSYLGYDFGCPGDWFQMSCLSRWFYGYPNGERNNKSFPNTPWWHIDALLIWCDRSYVSPRVLCWL